MTINSTAARFIVASLLAGCTACAVTPEIYDDGPGQVCADLLGPEWRLAGRPAYAAELIERVSSHRVGSENLFWYTNASGAWSLCEYSPGGCFSSTEVFRIRDEQWFWDKGASNQMSCLLYEPQD